jgi:uncharacterized membrane protein
MNAALIASHAPDTSKPPLFSNPQATAQVRGWLRSGYADFQHNRARAILYGAGVTALAWLMVAALIQLELSWMVLPAVSGMLLPLLSAGLYLMVNVMRDQTSAHCWAQLSLAGAILIVLQLAWLRAATILFALVFGLKPFPGALASLEVIFGTPAGWLMLTAGSAVGGLFAAFGFAITAFAIPMLVDRRVDAFTAMGRSFSKVAHNLPVTLRWATALTALTALSVLSAGLLFIAIFPILGFSTWHAYRDMFE